jgi:hypothetical protein
VAGAARSGIGLPFFVLAVLCFLPTTLFYFLMHPGIVSSLAPGTMLVCIAVFGLVLGGAVQPVPAVRVTNYVSLAVLIGAVLVAHFVGSMALGGGTEFGRTLLSVPTLLLMLAGGFSIATVFRERSASLNQAISLVRWTLIGLTVLSVIGLRPFQGEWEKPVFPFSEPSHLALVLNPFLLHACIINRGMKRLLWLAGSTILAYLAASLTLLVGLALVALLSLPFLSIGIAAGTIFLASRLLDLSYFTSRLDFNPDTQNISSLVYRQGWELLRDAIERTSAWGVGFQQLGYAPFRSPSADVLYAILRTDTNTRDGGFLIAKIVAELGILGMLLVLAYVVIAFRAALQIRRVAQGRAPGVPPHVVFALCVVTSFSLDMFVRDVGYFASSGLLFVASLYILWEYRVEKGRRPFALSAQ